MASYHDKTGKKRKEKKYVVIMYLKRRLLKPSSMGGPGDNHRAWLNDL